MTITPSVSQMNAQPALHDCLILITRPSGEAGATAEALQAAGARVIACPAIEFGGLIEQNLAQIRPVLLALRDRGGWLLLPSPTAVRYFAELLARLQLEPADLSGLHIGTVGEGSAAVLHEHGLPVDFVPPVPRGSSLAEHLPAEAGAPVLILGSRQTRPELREALARRGLMVQTLPLYAPRPCQSGLQSLRRALMDHPDGPRPLAVLLLVTSPSAVDAILDNLTDPPDLFNGAGWIAIGPTTLRRMADRGIDPGRMIESSHPRVEAIAEAAALLAARLHARG